MLISMPSRRAWGQSEGLAKQAFASMAKAEPEMDGITYLRDNIAAGIHTLLTAAYRDEILKQTNTTSLDKARDKATGA
jgi:hypothetical protein